MIQYFNSVLILVLIAIAVIILLILRKKTDGDVYNKSDHEGFKAETIKEINTTLSAVRKN